jgi:hypothetical protein
MEKAQAIIDYAIQDDAKNMRDTLYSAIQDKVMAHINAQKIEVAKNLINPVEQEVDAEDAEVENA